jgi:hypothetical protein
VTKYGHFTNSVTEDEMTTISLGNICAERPCAPGWAKLTETLGTTDLSIELSIGDIVIANGRNDALWALRCLPPCEAVAAVMPAVKRASVHTTDQRVHDCIAAVDSWLAGDDSVDLKTAAVAEAWVASAGAASRAACAACAAWAASVGAEAAEARAAAWAAAWAARAAAEAMAAMAARAAEAAAKAAESAAAESAESAEWAEWAAEAARAAAAERDMQASDLLAMFPPIRLKAEVAA